MEDRERVCGWKRTGHGVCSLRGERQHYSANGVEMFF